MDPNFAGMIRQKRNVGVYKWIWSSFGGVIMVLKGGYKVPVNLIPDERYLWISNFYLILCVCVCVFSLVIHVLDKYSLFYAVHCTYVYPLSNNKLIATKNYFTTLRKVYLYFRLVSKELTDCLLCVMVLLWLQLKH